MTKATKVVSLIILLALMIPMASLSMPESAFSAGAITNGGFESGDFASWDVTLALWGNAQVVEQYESWNATYSAKEGSYFALLRPGLQNVYTVVSQPFSASGGSRISGWSFFKAEDYMPYDDEGRVEITVKSGGRVLSTLFQSSVSAVGDFGGTPWTHWSYVFTRSGQYTIEAKIANIRDSGYPSALGLDGVSLNDTPPQRPKSPPSASATAPPLILAKELGINPDEAYIGQPITISASMANEGDNSAEYTADLKINGQTEQLKTGDVDGHSSVPVSFTVTRSQAGTYTVDLSGQKGTFTVLAPQTNSTSSSAGNPTMAIILISALVLCAAGILIVALRHTA